jgi:hypothetical protein
VSARRGRPRKVRPADESGLSDCSSLRDLEAATGLTRRQITAMRDLASIPEDEFERLIESDSPPSVRSLQLMVRRRAGKSTEYVRRCPHCGMPLRIEDAG